MKNTLFLRKSVTFILLLFALVISAQEKPKTKSDSLKKATKELPLEPKRTISFTTDQGTWISVDVHPDGSTIIFDLYK